MTQKRVSSSVMLPAVSDLRRQFPALDKGLVYFENAGGSQVPRQVIDAATRYLQESYVQLGAPYAVSATATAIVDQAHHFARALVGGQGLGDVILGPSSTQLLYMLADCYSQILKSGDVVVIAENAHEANAGPWKRLQRFGIETRVWPLDVESMTMRLEDLEPLLTNERVKLLAFPHVSNLLGEVADVKAITDLAHKHGVKVVVDGVAFAPHRALDVADWDVDWYVFSTYKVYGPHAAVLFGTNSAMSELKGPNHFFVPEGVPYKFELGGANHESCAALLGTGRYVNYVASGNDEVVADRSAIVNAFERMESLESEPLEALLSYLKTRDDFTLVGPRDPKANRVPTISFVSNSHASLGLATQVCDQGVAIRNGHMYAYDLVKKLGINLEDGVVRISMTHYNTASEVESLIRSLESLR